MLEGCFYWIMNCDENLFDVLFITSVASERESVSEVRVTS